MIEEPLGGAHRDHALISERLKSAIERHLAELEIIPPDELRAQRQRRSPPSECSPRPRSEQERPGLQSGLADATTQGSAARLPARSLCVALSGGVDSTVLLAALAERKPLRSKLRAIHVNHHLHPNAKLWAAHCRELTARLGVPLTVLSAKVRRARGTSLEAEARKARYEMLAAELGERRGAGDRAS